MTGLGLHLGTKHSTREDIQCTIVTDRQNKSVRYRPITRFPDTKRTLIYVLVSPLAAAINKIFKSVDWIAYNEQSAHKSRV